jgi:hypothetical protein
MAEHCMQVAASDMRAAHWKVLCCQAQRALTAVLAEDPVLLEVCRWRDGWQSAVCRVPALPRVQVGGMQHVRGPAQTLPCCKNIRDAPCCWSGWTTQSRWPRKFASRSASAVPRTWG